MKYLLQNWQLSIIAVLLALISFQIANIGTKLVDSVDSVNKTTYYAGTNAESDLSKMRVSLENIDYHTQ